MQAISGQSSGYYNGSGYEHCRKFKKKFITRFINNKRKQNNQRKKNTNKKGINNLEKENEKDNSHKRS